MNIENTTFYRSHLFLSLTKERFEKLKTEGKILLEKK
jgi:hypothetical protein